MMIQWLVLLLLSYDQFIVYVVSVQKLMTKLYSKQFSETTVVSRCLIVLLIFNQLGQKL